MRIFDGKVYRDLTPEELAQMEHSAKVTAAEEKTRPLTEAEVSRMLLTQQVNTLAVDDNTAVRMMAFYPTFESIVGQTVSKGFKFTHGGKLWRVIQPSLTIQAHYAPGVGMESLYEEINETHDGTIDDPIPYNGNMELKAGKYYYQDSAIYLCTRDTVNPVYQPLKDLVDYVEQY
jgi:hypothetical protein